VIVPKEFQVGTTRFLELFSVSKERLLNPTLRHGIFSAVKPSSFIKTRFLLKILLRIRDLLDDYPGLFIMTRSVRSYPSPLASHALGLYRARISGRQSKDSSKYFYTQGDYVGLSGNGSYYEKRKTSW